MAAQNNFGIKSVWDRFSGAGAYTESNNALHLKLLLLLWVLCKPLKEYNAQSN